MVSPHYAWAQFDTRSIFLPRLPQGGEGRGEEPMFTCANPPPRSVRVSSCTLYVLADVLADSISSQNFGFS
jgi:hypothetical protein